MGMINEPTSIKGLFQGLVPEGMNIDQGVVLTAAPLTIQLVNDAKLVLNTNTLCVPKHLTNYQVSVSLSGGTVNAEMAEEEEHRHKLESITLIGATMTVNNALQAGERVYLLNFNEQKKYYVLGRVV